MDDQQGTKRQDDQQSPGGGEASKGINPVQHSERGINPRQNSEAGILPVDPPQGRQADEAPGRPDERGGGTKGNEKGNG
jgi:hypothetical protein